MAFWDNFESNNKALQAIKSSGKIALNTVGMAATVAIGSMATLAGFIVDIGPLGLGLAAGTVGLFAFATGNEGIAGDCFAFAGSCMSTWASMFWLNSHSNTNNYKPLTVSALEATAKQLDACKENISKEVAIINDLPKTGTVVQKLEDFTNSVKSLFGFGKDKPAPA
jgi:hypothetical protein